MEVHSDVQIMGEGHFSFDHFATVLGVSKSTIEKWARDGKGPKSWKLGRRHLISEKSARDFIAHLQKG